MGGSAAKSQGNVRKFCSAWRAIALLLDFEDDPHIYVCGFVSHVNCEWQKFYTVHLISKLVGPGGGLNIFQFFITELAVKWFHLAQ